MDNRAEETLIERGTGNVYADLGMPDADEMLAKAKLVTAIGKTLKQRRLTQSAAARIMGIDQPEVSQLLKGDFRGYSSDRLMQFLTLLGQDVVITIVPHMPEENERGQVSISMAQGL
jgi:predicted XRE-type DNA-binding protein